MDPEDESTAYLKFFNDTPQSFLLQNTDSLADESFQVESIFTEIGSDWTSETFPILLSGPLVAEDNNDDVSNINNHILEENNETEEPSTSCNNREGDNTVQIYGNLDKNHVILSNEVLVQVSEPNANQQQTANNIVTHVINGEPYSITYTQENIPGEVIKLVNLNTSNLQKIAPKPTLQNYYKRVEAFKCSFCGCLCETEDEISGHLSAEHVENVSPVKMTSILKVNNNAKKYMLFLCSDCGNAYSSKEDLKNHMVTQHNLVSTTTANRPPENRQPDAETAKQLASSNRTLSTRLVRKQQQAMKKVKCSIKGCSYRFARDDLRKRHEECHVDGHKSRFQCPECGRKFSVWRICSMHIWRCHAQDIGLLTCPMCDNFKAMSPLNVINHMAIHTDEKPFVCPTCAKAFKQLSQLKNHEMSHKSADELTNCYTMKKCQYCQSHFANAKSLRNHIKSVHHKFKPFMCNICGHKTSRKEMLQVHYRQHTGDKPFVCDHCSYKTADRNCLRRHVMRHFGVTKYLCSYCDYQSIQSSSYKRHLANKHPGKEGVFACEKCKYVTINFSKFWSHIKTHENEEAAEKNTNGTMAEPTSEKVDRANNLTSNSITEDEETQTFLNNEHSEEVVDTGGITIPAEFDLPLNKT